MQLKTKLAAAGIGVLALSGSALGALVPGTASATPAPTVSTATATNTPSVTGDTAPGQTNNTNATDETTAETDTPGGAHLGDQTAPDANTQASDGTTAESDGPGGHQDQPNANVNHDFQGQE